MSSHNEIAAADSSPPAGGLLLSAASLWEREMVRFLRQPSRIAGLLAAPLLFWIFLGSGLGDSFRPQDTSGGDDYLQYFFPGTVVMIVLFASIFSNMSTIEDRRAGFLLSVLVAPIPRAGLVLGKILGGTTQALVPGLLFLLLAPLVGFDLQFGQAFLAALVLFLISFSLTSLGFVIAWWMDSVQGFHAILNLVLMPAWVLSGALFPFSGASFWVRGIMRANPMTYEVEALRGALMENGLQVHAVEFPLGRSLELTALFALVTILAALLWSGRPSVKHLS
ncbi:MAG: ABC transporter permease [Acidobacteria bacterium]|nr:ABC transporter permease [Acidobacteriota bacterium]